MQQQGYQSYNVISCILYPRLLRSKLLVTRISFSNLFIGFSALWGEQAGLHQTNIIAFDLSTTSAINVSPDLRDLYPTNNQRLSKTQPSLGCCLTAHTGLIGLTAWDVPCLI